MGLTNLVLYATPFFLLSMWLEYKVSEESGKKLYSRQDFLTNAIIGIIDLLLAILVSALVTSLLYVCYTFFEDYRMSWFGYRHLGWSVSAWLLALLLDDFTYYWFHRTSHRVRLLWACHIVHHNSEKFNFSTAIRNSWLAVFYKPLYWTWLAMLGFHPLMILTCISISACYQFFCHTELLPVWDRLSAVLNTPGLHAIHHGKEGHCIDKNYAGVFSFYDRLFGTYQPVDKSMNVTYGVTHPPRSQQFAEVNFHEFRNLCAAIRKAGRIRHKILYLLKGPEWKPSIDGVTYPPGRNGNASIIESRVGQPIRRSA